MNETTCLSSVPKIIVIDTFLVQVIDEDEVARFL